MAESHLCRPKKPRAADYRSNRLIRLLTPSHDALYRCSNILRLGDINLEIFLALQFNCGA